MKNYILTYNQPAEHTNKGWQNQVLPVGNGYMGMCIHGGVATEHLQINEKTLWAGGPATSRPDYNGGNISGKYESLKAIQDALSSGNKKEVLRLKDQLVGLEEGYGNYLNFGEIVINTNHSNFTNYQRSLDIDNAIASVCYDTSEGRFKREYFASYPDRVLATKLSGDTQFDAEISFKLAHDGGKIVASKNGITVSGAIADNGLKYYAQIDIVTDGKISRGDGTISIKATKDCKIFFSAGTNYCDCYPKYRGEECNERVKSDIEKAIMRGYDTVRKGHIADYKELYDRVKIDLGGVDNGKYTDQLLSQYKLGIVNQDSKYLEELLYNYGKYLIISSSRVGSLPANLQGVWNNSNAPAWGCDYHLNVNLQMCYWHTYSTNLSETVLPLLKYMESLRVAGRETAKAYHNIVSDENNKENGWVCHTQCTPFGWTCPGWDFYWGWSPASSSWMMQNCYDYYKYTGDKKILKEQIYPMMKENAKFWLQNLIYNNDQKRWVSSPSYSPEHGPISVGNAFEQELIYLLLRDTLEAGKVLGDDSEFLAQLESVKDNLSPLAVGRWGQVKEWYEEDSWYKHELFRKSGYRKNLFQFKHRHASHLIGLYPALHIKPDNKELFDACRISLGERGLGGVGNNSGWGKANKIGMWARVKDGNQAYILIKSLIKHNIANNLWDLHPPFQMDGNCGYTAGVGEMLVYSDDDIIELLPAIPKEWSKGSITGIVARGNVIIDMKWDDGKVVEYKIFSKQPKVVNIRVNGEITKQTTQKI